MQNPWIILINDIKVHRKKIFPFEKSLRMQNYTLSKLGRGRVEYFFIELIF